MIFGSGMSSATSARQASREAVEEALRPFGRTRPKLALLFVSMGYDDVTTAPHTVRDALGDVPILGGSAGPWVVGPHGIGARGVSVVLVGGDDMAVAARTAALESPELVDVVPAAQEIARAADEAARRGLGHFACLLLAPGLFVDGEALVAAARKGAGARAQLAGGLTGDDLTMDRPGVFVRGELRKDHVSLAGIFSSKHVGIAARHGFEAVGPVRTITRADGPILIELDHRPALDVWLEDARAAGATPPESAKELSLYLANNYGLALTGGSRSGAVDSEDLVARAPFEIRHDRTIKLSGSIGEGRNVRVSHGGPQDLLRAAADAAASAATRSGGNVAGALVLPCAGRPAVLGEEFEKEPMAIRERLSAPIGGACVYGEIAKTARDVDAFFNTTVVVVAFPR